MSLAEGLTEVDGAAMDDDGCAATDEGLALGDGAAVGCTTVALGLAITLWIDVTVALAAGALSTAVATLFA